LLDHESLVRQVGHNLLDDHECGETIDRKPPGVSYYYVIPVWQSFFLGNIEKELHETLFAMPMDPWGIFVEPMARSPI
jgi:hypothetical protein